MVAASKVAVSDGYPSTLRICQVGSALLTKIAAAQAVAAPEMPASGISSTFKERLVTSAAMLLTRLWTLLPIISRAMSTGPAAVPINIARERMTTTGLPDE